MSRFDVLSRNVNVFGNRFLEASAGTGKTFAIEHLVVRLLLESKQKISIDQILVVTFTRAATRELKARIRSNLEKAYQSLLSGNEGPDYLKAIFEKEAERGAFCRRIEEALICFDEAQIFTIHGFCHRMLSEFAFDALLRFDLSDPDSMQHRAKLQQAVMDFFLSELRRPFYSPSQVAALLGNYRNDIEKVIEKIVSLLEKKGQIQPLPDFDALYHAFKAQMEELFVKSSYEKSKFVEDYLLISSNYKKMTDPGFLEQAELMGSLLETRSCTNEQFEDLLKRDSFFLEALDPKNLKSRAKVLSDDAFHYPGIFDALRKKILPLIQVGKDPVKIALRIAKDCEKYLLDSGLAKEIFSPDEILRKMEQCIDQPHFAAQVRKKYKAVIVDEFQDTDPIQWSIFERLFLNDGIDAFYLVGDPKQSIYSFRSADVYTYLEAASSLGQSCRFVLDTNFRSDPSLVHALNALFSKSKSSWLSLPTLGTYLEYYPVLAKSGAQDHVFEDDREKIHFFIAESELGREKRWPTDHAEKQLLFPFIAQEIHKLLKMNFSFSQIAILVKDRYQGKRLQDFLKEQAISASMKKESELVETKGYFALLELLNAVLFPHDLGKVKLALGGLFILFDHDLLKGGLEQEHLQNAVLLFKEWKTVWQERGIGAFFEEFLASKFKDCTILENLVSTEDLTLYREFRYLSQLLIERETEHQVYDEALFNYLKELKNTQDAEVKIPALDDEDAVLIMTSHLSKGLEFDIVFALGIASRHVHREDIVYIQQEKKVRVEEFKAEDAECQKHLKEIDAEKMRQLYVALTRAKKRLYIPALFDLEAKEPSLGSASPLELFLAKTLEKELPILKSSFISYLDELGKEYSISYTILGENVSLSKKETEKALVELFAPAPCNISLEKETILSFSSLSHKKSSEHSLEGFQSDSLAKTAHTLPPGAETGTLLHYILEKIFKKQLHRVKNENISILIKDVLAKTHLEGWEEVFFEMIDAALHLPLVKENSFTLSQLLPSQVLPEMEFLYPHQKNLIKGFADLVFEHEKKYYILDWKSNWLGTSDDAYSISHLEKAMEANEYFLQGSIYTIALKRYVKLFDNRSFEECFGGAFYLFLRGKNVYHFIPDILLKFGVS